MEELKEFIKKLKTDKVLSVRLAELAEKRTEFGAIITLADEHGYVITAKGLEKKPTTEAEGG